MVVVDFAVVVAFVVVTVVKIRLVVVTVVCGKVVDFLVEAGFFV